MPNDIPQGCSLGEHTVLGVSRFYLRQPYVLLSLLVKKICQIRCICVRPKKTLRQPFVPYVNFSQKIC